MSGSYQSETIGAIMSRHVPTCHGDDTQRVILALTSGKKWDSVHNIYVVERGKLLGVVHVAALLHAGKRATARELMEVPGQTLSPDEDQENAIFYAIRDDVIAIPVVSSSGRFLGAVTAHTLIDIMHDEHVEDALLTAGIHGKASHITKLAAERTFLIVRGRAPWLIFGLLVGLGLGLLSSFFEHALQANVAIAYFIPVVAYIADSVGTQSEAIAVRALATLKINYPLYLIKELLVGSMLGVLVGVLGGVGAMLIAHSPYIGLAVGLALFVASVIAAVLAALIPMMFKLLGKDPALGSGPLATALQDLISILVYFSFAMLLVA